MKSLVKGHKPLLTLSIPEEAKVYLQITMKGNSIKGNKSQQKGEIKKK